MAPPVLVIVSGPPCTGKTTLGLRLASDFHLPFINKDGIKELLFERLGWKDREWSRHLGLASYDILYYFTGQQLEAGISTLLESNFKPEFDTPRFLALREQYPFTPFQIQCQTKGEVLLERFRRRSGSGERHPGHVDYLNDFEFEETLLKGAYQPLDVGGHLFTVDTTEFSSVDYGRLVSALSLLLPGFS